MGTGGRERQREKVPYHSGQGKKHWVGVLQEEGLGRRAQQTWGTLKAAGGFSLHGDLKPTSPDDWPITVPVVFPLWEGTLE